MLLKLLIPLFFSLSVYGQTNRYLIIKHRTNGKEIVVQEGEFVAIKTFKGESVRGRMLVLSETLIQVKHKVVPLTSVEKMGVRNSAVLQFGSAALSMGMNLVLYGIQSGFRDGWDKVDRSYTASIPFLSVGFSMMWFTHKRRSKHWTYHGQLPNW